MTTEFLFVGLDANYSSDIEQSTIFPKILEYHKDGPDFWRRHGVHHPFLLPQYNGDGRRYHQRFSKIGFQPKHANKVSFVELLNIPTVGRNSLAVEDLSESHLAVIRETIFKGRAKYIFLSPGVQRLMQTTRMFNELNKVKREFGALRVLYEDDDRAVFLHLHFSNYGKFEQQLQLEACEIAGFLAHSDA